MRHPRLIAAALLALAASAGQADRASAAPPPPAALEVQDGDGWRSETGYSVTWTSALADPPILAAHYLIRNPDGAVVSGPDQIGLLPTQHTIGLAVPPVAGTYRADVWLEDAAGAEGPPATVNLRFDRGRPGFSEPIQPSGWISQNELPYAIRLTHPTGTAPLSGILGYAVSIDANGEASPCAAADRCTDAETDLRDGVDGNALLVSELPEGRSYVHAAAVSGSRMRSVTPGHTALWVDRTDPLTRLSGARPGWTNHPAVLEATATDSASGMASAGDGRPFTAIQVDGGAPIVSAGDSVETTVIEEGEHTISFYARDAAGNVNDGDSANGHANAPPAAASVRIDRVPPFVTLIGSADPDDPELIEARVSDPLSGPDPGRGRIMVRRAGSSDPYQLLPTAGRGEALWTRWQSDEYPEGEYEFRATGYDAAGNASTTTRRGNGSLMLLPNPLKARTLLSVWFARGGAARQAPLSVAYGRGAVFQGRIVATSDAPLSDKSVRVVERFDWGAAVTTRTTVVDTGGDGRFGLRLAPGGSREVLAIFGGTRAATGTASRPLRLGVRGGVGLRASASLAKVGGRPVSFRGRVACSPADVPAGGVSVQLQFRAPGLDWTEFRTLQTNRRGRFHYSYRFSDDDSRGVRFQFRAFVPAQSDWPYEPGGSRPVAVRGA